MERAPGGQGCLSLRQIKTDGPGVQRRRARPPPALPRPAAGVQAARRQKPPAPLFNFCTLMANNGPELVCQHRFHLLENCRFFRLQMHLGVSPIQKWATGRFDKVAADFQRLINEWRGKAEHGGTLLLLSPLKDHQERATAANHYTHTAMSA